jgi:hypothetical protein
MCLPCLDMDFLLLSDLMSMIIASTLHHPLKSFPYVAARLILLEHKLEHVLSMIKFLQRFCSSI